MKRFETAGNSQAEDSMAWSPQARADLQHLLDTTPVVTTSEAEATGMPEETRPAYRGHREMSTAVPLAITLATGLVGLGVYFDLFVVKPADDDFRKDLGQNPSISALASPSASPRLHHPRHSDSPITQSSSEAVQPTVPVPTAPFSNVPTPLPVIEALPPPTTPPVTSTDVIIPSSLSSHEPLPNGHHQHHHDSHHHHSHGGHHNGHHRQISAEGNGAD